MERRIFSGLRSAWIIPSLSQKAKEESILAAMRRRCFIGTKERGSLNGKRLKRSITGRKCVRGSTEES